MSFTSFSWALTDADAHASVGCMHMNHTSNVLSGIDSDINPNLLVEGRDWILTNV